MNWYKKAKLNKIATMDVVVDGFRYPQIPETLLNISNSIMYSPQLSNYLKNLPEEEREYFKENHLTELVTPDTSSSKYNAPIGHINIYLRGLNPNRIKEYNQLIQNILKTLKLEFDEPKIDISNMYDSKVLRINITRNPHAYHQLDIPPELNLANENASRIFNGILKTPMEDINAAQLISRINSITRKDKIEFEHEGLEEQTPSGMKIIEPPKSMEYYDQRLERIKEIAQWALDHGYKTISVI